MDVETVVLGDIAVNVEAGLVALRLMTSLKFLADVVGSPWLLSLAGFTIAHLLEWYTVVGSRDARRRRSGR